MFTIQRLVNDRAVVKGTDIHGTSGSTIIFTNQWDELEARVAHDEALADFDAKVEEFFAPISEAAEALEKTHFKQVDPLSVIVIEEPEEHRRGNPGTMVQLTRDSQILRLIDQGNTDRLIWVGDDLEISAYVPDDQPATAPVDQDNGVAPATV